MGRPFGIPVYVGPTWFLVAAWITYTFAPAVQSRLPGIGPAAYLVSFAFAVLLYLSVLVHELSHALVALRFGLPVRRISLYLLGGVAEIDGEPQTPGREFAVAFAGPLLSLVLAGGGWALLQVVDRSSVAGLLVLELATANLLVAIFNILPGLPLDGGRVLRAAVWKATGRSSTGTLVAAWAGRALAILVFLVPVLLAMSAGRQVGTFDLVWGALIGSFVWIGASAALKAGRVRERLPAIEARRLSRRAMPVAHDLPLAEALRRAGALGASGLVVVDGEGRPTGLVNEAAVTATPVERRPWVQVGAVSRRIEPGLVLSTELTGAALVQALQATPASEYLVTEPTGEVYGVLAAADVQRAFAGT